MQKKVLTAAIAGALAAPMAAQAVDFTISGHVNRAIFILDSALADLDADHNSAEVANNGSSTTRIRVKGSSELMEGNSAGMYIEYQETSDGSLGLRHSNVWFSGAFGKMTLGQTSEAGDGGVYRDKSSVFGVGVGQGNHSNDKLQGDYFNSYDGGGRVNAIRYDTPAFGPITVSGSVANGDKVSAAVRGSMKTDAVDFGGTIATHMAPNGVDTTNISFGTKFSNGFTWSGAWAQKTLADGETGDDPGYWQTMVGYVFGNNSVAIGYYDGEDQGHQGSKSTAIGIGFEHRIPKAGVEIYAAAQNYEVEDANARLDTTDAASIAATTGTGFATGNKKEDETVITIGTRIMF